MKCDQARDMLLDRLDGEARLQAASDLDLHISECSACQIWYKQQELAAAALEQLEPYRVPEDFTDRVLAQLPERNLSPRRDRATSLTRVSIVARQAWRNLNASLSSPVGRRRLVPVLVTAAAALVLAVGLFAVWQGAGVPVTPGAAAGSPAGFILAGSVLLLMLIVLGVFLLRRK